MTDELKDFIDGLSDRERRLLIDGLSDRERRLIVVAYIAGMREVRRRVGIAVNEARLVDVCHPSDGDNDALLQIVGRVKFHMDLEARVFGTT
jgi:hypothetical protein